MASERRVLAKEMRSEKKKFDALLETLRSSSSYHLDSLVKKAMGHFQAGDDPNDVYVEFDVEKLAFSLALDRRSGAEALLPYRGKGIEEQLTASMFVSMAIITINGTDPHLARLVLGHILRKGAEDPEFSDLSKMVMLGIAQTVHSASESEPLDPSLLSLADACVRRLKT